MHTFIICSTDVAQFGNNLKNKTFVWTQTLAKIKYKLDFTYLLLVFAKLCTMYGSPLE